MFAGFLIQSFFVVELVVVDLDAHGIFPSLCFVQTAFDDFAVEEVRQKTCHDNKDCPS